MKKNKMQNVFFSGLTGILAVLWLMTPGTIQAQQTVTLDEAIAMAIDKTDEINLYHNSHSVFDGILQQSNKKDRNNGKYIAAGDPLCEIIDKNDILIRLTAYEKDLNRIKTGDKIRFSVNGIENEYFTGEVISMGQHVDNINRSLEVFAKVAENHPLFRPGMYVNAQVTRML